MYHGVIHKYFKSCRNCNFGWNYQWHTFLRDHLYRYFFTAKNGGGLLTSIGAWGCRASLGSTQRGGWAGGMWGWMGGYWPRLERGAGWGGWAGVWGWMGGLLTSIGAWGCRASLGSTQRGEWAGGGGGVWGWMGGYWPRLGRGAAEPVWAPHSGGDVWRVAHRTSHSQRVAPCPHMSLPTPSAAVLHCTAGRTRGWTAFRFCKIKDCIMYKTQRVV